MLKNGELVAFPTETVYGLGAAAFQSRAAEKIFIAKGRAGSNPLLVHLSSREQAENIAREIPAAAIDLMERFWPGPLSIILPAREDVPAIVRGGKDTVGLRMPSHPVALALITEAGPLAAPSANLSGRPSPVTAEHVRADLDGRIAAVLDGGPTGLGLESTIIDLSGPEYRILRQGAIAIEELEAAMGKSILLNNPGRESFPHHRIKSRILLSRSWGEFGEYLNNAVQMERKTACIYTYIDRIDAPWEEFKEKHPQYRTYELNLGFADAQFYSILREAEGENDLLLFTPLPDGPGGIARAIIERIYLTEGKRRSTEEG